VFLVPTHRTGLADAIAAAIAEIATAQGSKVRYHHVGPLGPAACWDRWEGTAFVDPTLSGEDKVVGLYEGSTRRADLSVLSASVGVLDRRDSVKWTPLDIARLLDSPVVVVVDCRGWGSGLELLVSGLKSRLTQANLVGAILSGVASRDHYGLLRQVCVQEKLPVVGCLYEAEGLGWETPAPGAWGLPLDTEFLQRVSRQIDVGGLISLAGQRGFLSTQDWPGDRRIEGPTIAVAGGKGFTPWSRESIDLLRLAGAQVLRLDLVEDSALPPGTAGLVLAGTLWPDAVADVAMNTPLLRDIATQIGRGLPTVALGGGMLVLLERVQDSLGRTSELAGVVPAEGEILWELEEPAYVEVTALRDNLLLAAGERVTGWVLTDADLGGPGHRWDSPLAIRSGGVVGERGEGVGTASLLCTPALIHLAASRGAAARFVQRCAGYAARCG
jgi:cobyrinic acid a,c-diamide synthase